MPRRLVASGSYTWGAAHDAQNITLTPPANLHVQSEFVVEFKNPAAVAVNVDVYNVDTVNCYLCSFALAASTNYSFVVQGLFVPSAALFTVDPLANYGAKFEVLVYESAENL